MQRNESLTSMPSLGFFYFCWLVVCNFDVIILFYLIIFYFVVFGCYFLEAALF